VRLCAVFSVFLWHAGAKLEQSASEINANLFKVTLGQLISFTIIIAVSLIGMALGATISDGYIDLVGFVPILVGGEWAARVIIPSYIHVQAWIHIRIYVYTITHPHIMFDEMYCAHAHAYAYM
jgi:hypothetical protein